MSGIADVPEPIDRPSETNWDDELVFDRPTPASAQPPADRTDRTDRAASPDPSDATDATDAPDPTPSGAIAATEHPIDQSAEQSSNQSTEQPVEVVDSGEPSIEPLVEPSPTPEPIPAPTPDTAEPVATETPTEITPEITPEIAPETADLGRLSDRVAALTAERDRLTAEITQARADMGRLLSLGTAELEQRRKTLMASIEQLERRQERIRQEMKGTFAGASQNVAARVQGFKDYLVGSLQELVAAAEELPLVPAQSPAPAPTPDRDRPNPTAAPPSSSAPLTGSQFQSDRRKIEQILERYRTRPDYYGPPWRLRRTFEQVHADRVAQWFFDLGGRGALRTMGSRLQNVLVVSATISVLRAIHGDRLRTLILIDSPERLGDWRRGLQDSLGISRADFGAEQGVMLFESPDPLAQRADRIQRSGGVPFIIVDESDGRISLSLLQFPLWLAISPDPRIAPPPNTNIYDNY